MTRRSADLVAAAAAVALLVAAPFGLAVGFAIAASATSRASTVVGDFPALLELTTACLWVGGVFLPIAWLSRRFRVVGSAPLGTGIFAAAFAAGMLGFYRADPLPGRILYSAQYALLVLLAFLLFGFLAGWLESRSASQS